MEQDSNHINLENPASFSSLKLTTFSMGGTYGTKTFKTNTESANARRTTLDYLAVGLPLGKFGLGFGLIPYSSVGYRIQKLSSDVGETNKRLSGTGGLNKVFLGIGYKITPNFSIGADANYNFGKIETNSLEIITNVPLGTRELNSAELSGVNFNIGTMYQAKLSKKLSLYSSLNYTIEGSLTSKNTRNISTVVYNSTFDLSVVDSYGEQKTQSDVRYPSKISFGMGIGESKKWLLGGKIAYQKTYGQENTYNTANNVGYGRFGSVSLGGYYIPNYNSFSSYTKRIVYRAGLKYEKTGLMINSESINDMGLTLGFGLPITGSFSNVNLGFELGKKGTTNANLIQENYANFSVGFSLNDKWFEKRKFN